MESRGKWVDAGDLRVGDVLRDALGRLEPVTALSVRELGDQRVYNLTVATTHTFHVGTGRMLVHNCGGGADDVAPKMGSQGGPGAGSRHIPEKVKQQEIADSKGLCRICKVKVQPKKGSPLSREFDHAWPFSRGGDSTIKNIQALCRACNRAKGKLSTREYLRKRAAQRAAQRRKR